MNLKYRKEILDFLKEQELNLLKNIIYGDVKYRLATSLFLANPKNDKLNAQQTQTKLLKEGWEMELKYLRETIKAVEEDRIIIE